MLRIVLDTNVLVSGLNFRGNESRVMDLASEGRIEVYVSHYILGELNTVLERKFHQDVFRRQQHIVDILGWANLVEPVTPVMLGSRDPADNPILACCLEVGADYLITGDRRDLLPMREFHGTIIVSATTLLSVFEGLQN